MSEPIKFAVGGAVQIKQGTYLPRPADHDLFEACQATDFSYVLACRQIGKSSLMLETAGRLQQAGVKTVSVDLNAIGQQSVSAEQWYFSLIDELARRLRLETDVQTWWETRPSLSSMSARFLQFFREVVLQEVKASIVIFIDEIDTTLALPFTDDFFAAIRTIYNERAQEPDYQRLTFVLLGVATPDELIKDNTRTPFNIGRAITLLDFTEAECAPFRTKLEAAYPKQGGRYFDQIYGWTSGHPYLTQKLCQAVLDAGQDENPNLVDSLVHKIFLAPEARGGEDNIQFVQSRVRSDDYVQRLLRLYKRVLEAEKSVPDDEKSPAAIRLKLYGLLVEQGGHLVVRNQIYAQAFNQTWADEMLGSVRLGLPDKYSILQRIKQRSFVTVYMAQDTEAGQLVALKVLNIRDEDETGWVEWLKRVEQEARLVAESHHSNIIQIHETGRISETTLFIAMEYITGGTLRDRLQAGPLPRNEAVEMARQIGSALSQAHEQGVLHLGVNAQDILLDTTQKSLRPVVTDFGFAKFLPEAPLSDMHRDYQRDNLGYVAPEQEQQQAVTPATDVYGLAVTFLEMLTGQLPNRRSGEPLPPLSTIMPDLGDLFDPVLIKATAASPADRYQTVADFLEAIEAANRQTEQIEQSEQLAQAASAVELAKNYIRTGHYDPDRALSMVELALEMSPDYLEALRLRGRIRLEQKEFQAALADYQQAYQQVQDPFSKVGLEYLQALERVADDLWERHRLLDAVEHYEMIRQILGGRQDKQSLAKAIWQNAHDRLVEYHYRQGDNAYTSRSGQAVDEVIDLLEQEIEALEALGAGRESKDLRGKVRQLKIEKYQQVIRQAHAAIKEIDEQGSQIRFTNEDIFQHYAAIDAAYEALLALDSKNESWLKERQKKLAQQAQTRALFAERALNKFEPDYVAALRHYNAVLELEQNKYPGLAQKLHLDLDHKIAEIEEEADYDGKYRQIRDLMDNGEYHKALERLDQDFIQTGNYEHREVARWLWGLVHVKQHGEFPAEWEGVKVLKPLRQRLTATEQVWTQALRAKLEPWSLDQIAETVVAENKILTGYEQEVQRIETFIEEAVKHGGVEKTPRLQNCRQELVDVKAQIAAQREALQIDQPEVGQKFDLWLQKVADIEALLQKDNSINDMPEFLNKVDQERAAIETDPLFTTQQALFAHNAGIDETIRQMKLRIKRRLVEILVDDIGQRNETIAKLSQAVEMAQEAAKAAHQERDKVRSDLARAQEDVAAWQRQAQSLQTALENQQQREADWQRRLETVQKQGKLNKYVIPLAFASAIVTGAFIAPRLSALVELSILGRIALIGLFAYAAYYAWVYYWPQGRGQ